MMSAVRPKEVASGGSISEIFVRPISTPEKSSDKDEKLVTSSSLSSPTSTMSVDTQDRFMSAWEKIKATTPMVSIPPIDYEDLNSTYATRKIEMPSDVFVGPTLDDLVSKPRTSTTGHGDCQLRIGAMRKSAIVKDRLIAHLKTELGKFMVNEKNPYEKRLETLSRLYVEEKILSDLQDRLFSKKECAFETRIKNLELDSLEKAIFKSDCTFWTFPK